MANQTKVTKETKSPKRTTQPAKERKGWPDVAIRFIDASCNLLNSGNFIGFIALAFVLLLFLVVWRLPPETLGNLVGTILKILESDKYSLFLLSGTLFVSLIGNFIQRYVYKAEIRRLTHQRKRLIHGLENGSLKALEKHNPSEFDINNGD
jgi:hypothetical protein